MNAKHTPGPWAWEDGEYECGGPCTPDGCVGHRNGVPEYLHPVGIIIEEYPDDIERWKADAALIAAAPELLEACEALIETVDTHMALLQDETHLSEPEWAELRDKQNDALVAMRAVIAKVHSKEMSA